MREMARRGDVSATAPEYVSISTSGKGMSGNMSGNCRQGQIIGRLHTVRPRLQTYSPKRLYQQLPPVR